MREEEFPYEDILRRPHHVSKHHPHMPLLDRAAQFSPFAALRGYEDAISESGRFTKKRPELSEDAKRELDEKLRKILSRQICDERDRREETDESGKERLTGESGEIEIYYFEEDPFKEGGEVRKIQALPIKLDEINGILVLKDKRRIPLEDIVDLQPAETTIAEGDLN
jgi:hypothetical protein